MIEIPVGASTPYAVRVGRGVSAEAAPFVRAALGRVRTVAVVADSTVAALHADALLASLAAAGLGTALFVFPAGEKSKSLATYGELVAFLASRRLARTDLVLALGGGVTGDLAGFAAATYMRGVAFVQMPTSLLAMVDSSVGGKTAVDLAAGKNLVGAFHQPRAVFCDTAYLDTLPDAWRQDGMGEVFKYAVLGSEALFARLEAAPRAPIAETDIAACIDLKRAIVEADEKESGVRKLLNLGHTYAHAIETLSAYGVSHGRAVATGVVMAARAAGRRGLLPAPDVARVGALAEAMGFDATAPYSAAALAEAMASDKKVSAGSIDLVLPSAIGRCGVFETPFSRIGKDVDDGQLLR